MVKVRFAPSPTGIPHIGNTKTALYNFLFARANKGEFILRIEDTDQKRVVDGAEKAILEILDWLGLKYDGKPIHQSERLEIYKKYVQELLDKKIAHQKEGAIWVKVPEGKTFEWTDKIGNKKIRFLGKDVDEFVILKSDGFPTYHLANIVDDHLTEITDVIRGEEWISSTPKHLFLYESFGWTPPNFAHMPVILGPDKTKLSKRHGAKSALDYRNEGFVKEALLNFMALLGWNPGGNQEQMSLNFMTKNFKLEDVNSASPIFDIQKLEWLNGVWLRSFDEGELEKRLREYYSQDSAVLNVLNKNKTTKGIIIGAAQSRMRTLADFKKLISEGESARKKTKEEKEVAVELHKFIIGELGDKKWENEKFLAALKNFSKTKNVPFKLIYFLLSGKEQGIGLLELNQIYGKDFFIKNLEL
ncbi:MAG: glutamate--tRNA ligase family protein [Candidatus Levyibacteriota bacterium]|jgi:glutamyl/glutaminyl-tRNA synthetase